MPRTRTRIVQSELRSVKYYNHPYNQSTGLYGTPTVVSQTNARSSILNESITDVVTKGFERIRSNGGIVNNPYSQSKVHEIQGISPVSELFSIYGPSSNTYVRRDGEMTFGQAMAYYAMAAYSSYLSAPSYNTYLASLSDQAVTSAYAGRTTSDTLALVTALELAKSILSIKGILKNVNKIASKTRKKLTKVRKHRLNVPYNIKPDDYKTLVKSKGKTFFKEFLENEKSIEDIWMEARYNLRPLYYDIIGLNKALTEPLSNNSRRTSRGFSSKEISQTSSYTKAFDGPYYYYAITVDRDVKVQITCRAGVLDQISSITRADKLGLYEIPASLWDLVPLSFVLDWFWNIGSTISAWTPRFGMNTLASWVTTEIVITQTNAAYCSDTRGKTSGSYHGTASVSLGGVFASKTTIYKTRTPNPALSVLPTFNVRMDPAKLIDLGIILKQLALNKTALKKYRI